MSDPDSTVPSAQPAGDAVDLDLTGLFKLEDLKTPPPAPALPKELPEEIVIGAGEVAAGNFFVNFARARPKRSVDRSKTTILVVEDNVAVRTLLNLLLIRAGYKVRLAENGAGFITAIGQKPVPDLLILDIHLPDVNGLKILAKVRAHPQLEKVAVILFTAQAGVVELARGVALGADGFISKPATAKTMMAAVETVLGE